MSFHFYLSSAPADGNEDLQRFFTDLNIAVRARLSPPENKTKIGFFEPRGIANGNDWRPEVAEALRTSQTMVALISPEYFVSEYAGKEWRLFEKRRQFTNGQRRAETEGGARSAIVPVIWIPCKNSESRIPSSVQAAFGDSNIVYREQGVLMLRSLDRFHDEYVDVLMSLSKQIIDTGRNARLPALDIVPPLAQLDSEFREKYKAVIVEDDKQVREMLGHFLSFNGFQCQSFKGAKRALE